MNKFFTLCLALLSFPASLMAQTYALKAEMLHTAAGPSISNGLVLVKEGKIEWVGPAKEKAIPKGYQIYSAKVITPGLIDGHSVVGLAGALNQPHDQDQLETSGSPLAPELSALDAYNPREVLVEYLRTMGVTTIHTGHGPGALISGQTLVAKTVGNNVQEAVIDASAMLAITLGAGINSGFKTPGTRSKALALLRQELLKAQTYLRKMEQAELSKRPERDLKMETLVQLLRGEIKALITVDRAHDIQAAIRIAKEFNLKLVLDSVSEAYLVIDEIKASGAEVILHPTMKRAAGESENLTFETAKILNEAGIPFSLQSGFEGYVPKTRVVLFEAGVAAAYGLPFEKALAAITIYPAKILGLDQRIGSLEVGKDADVVLFDGDPFEYTTHVCTVFVNGKVVSETCR
ncbi:MAG: amidohydrolase family protein [Bacteroidetes Order II. Incertae sedis bacterium]|nr:amidohydrolase family protein [Bacteroidetes Order II. bacterium]